MVPPPPIAISTVIEADVSDLDLKRPINVIADLKKRQRLDWKATHRRDPSSLLNPADFHDNGRSTLKDDCEVGAVLEVTELLGNPSDRTVTTENGDSVPRNVSNIHNNISSKESFQGSIEESDLIQETFVDIETSRGASPLTDSNVGPQQEEASLTTISSKRRTRRQPQFIPSQRDDGGLKRTPQFISTCDSKSSSQQGSTRFLSAAKRTFSSSKKDTLPFEEDQKSPSLSKISARSKILPCAIDFGVLDYSALKRYKKVFKLRGKLNITKTQLLGVIKEHASHQLILLGNSRNNALLGPSTSEVEGGIWIGDDIVAKFITYVKKERLAGPKLDKYSDLDDY